ncbi:MAG: PQQ-binding-like beta-propeller repeat protein [Bacillota bacterium]
MQNRKSKAMAIFIALFLTISVGASTILIPNASAHSPLWIITTYAYATATPNPAGVGQQMLIFGWLDNTINGVDLVNNIRFHNYQFTITQPDGTNVTQSFPVVNDPTSSQYFPFTPSQVGTYTVFFSFPGQIYDYGGQYQGDYYTPSNFTTTFTVKQDPVPSFIENPLPSAFWTRPINGMNILWDSVGSNWLGGAATANFWQQNGAAPRSAHVLWTKPLEFGGLTGGIVTQAGNTAQENETAATYYSGFSYNTRFNNPMIINGVLFYQSPMSEAGSGGGLNAVDLTTGQTLWTSSTLNPSKAQLIDFQSPNQHGIVGGILWQTSGSTWMAFNAYDGKFLFNLTNVPSGTEVYLNNGEIDRYVFSYSTSLKKGWLALWNSTLVITSNAGHSGSVAAGQYAWPTDTGFSINANLGVFVNESVPASYSWNVTINADLTGTTTPSIVGVIPGNVILGSSSSVGLTSAPRPNDNPWTMWALSDEIGSQGQLNWLQRYSAPSNNQTQMLATQPIDPVTNEWTMTYFETGQRLAYSLDTGNLVWGPSERAQTGFQYYSSREGLPAYGNLYVSGYGGVVYSYSMANGTLLWTYGNGVGTNSTSTGDNTAWGNYPTHIAGFANGIVYTMAGEHSPNTPLYRGYMARAIDAFTGKLIWALPDWSASGLGTSMAPIAIADGIMTFANAYDGQIYAVGKGPSETTINVQNNVIPEGNNILIQGSVLDISAGTKQKQQAADFPNGVPAVSDSSQTAWMQYVYQQGPCPTNATGVDVTLSTIDPNGNTYVIGTTTTDANGVFATVYKPPVPGTYKVFATFAGSDSYWQSSSETAFNVMQAPNITPTPTTVASQSMADLYFLPLSAVMIVLIIILIGVVVWSVLRKHP